MGTGEGRRGQSPVEAFLSTIKFLIGRSICNWNQN